MNRLLSIWTELRASLWFIPGLMIAGSLLLAFGLVELDARYEGEWETRYPLLFGVGTDGSRGMLTAIGSSMLTVAALAFSLTLNAVTQASNQFTPRIYRNFLRDRANQFVLGYFVSVFAYCLVVLRTIRSADEGTGFVPSIAVITGLLFALGGIFVVIFFIHHITTSLQINKIIDSIVDDTHAAIANLYPSKLGKGADDAAPEDVEAEMEREGWTSIPSRSHGYVQRVDEEGLLRFAAENGGPVKVDCRIGDFVGRGAPLASVTSGHHATEDWEEVVHKINDLFSIERERTIEQDVAFGIRQIVDIALKALSPGVNDTTTAVTCIDNLGEIVGEIVERRFPDPVRRSNGALLFVSAPEFADYAAMAFDQIRVSGRGNLAVLGRLVQALSAARSRTGNYARLETLREQLCLIQKEAERTLESDYERARFEEVWAAGLRNNNGAP